MSRRERIQGQKERWSVGEARQGLTALSGRCRERPREGSRQGGPAGGGGGERGRVTARGNERADGGEAWTRRRAVGKVRLGAAEEEKEGRGEKHKRGGRGRGVVGETRGPGGRRWGQRRRRRKRESDSERGA